MEDEVKDTILTGQTDDPVLGLLLEVTINSIVTSRPIFSNPLVEPDFYRKRFCRWVEEGMEEARKARQPGNEAPPPAS